MENNNPEKIEILETEHKTKKSCIYKKILSYVLLVTILASFCVLEIVVLIAIFSVFSVFYIIIFSVDILYLAYRGLRKLARYYKGLSTNKLNDYINSQTRFAA